jgi:hypothetical protein
MKNFGQVMNPYIQKAQDPLADEDDVLLDINLYLKQDILPSSLCRFNIRFPHKQMLVQTDLGIEGCKMEGVIGTLMVVHMYRRDRLMGGVGVYF